jgi:hydrogenase-1 operon protein HyaE
MTAALAWKPPRSAMSNNFSGLLDKLVVKHGIPELDQAGFQAFMDEPGNAVALLTEEPDTAACLLYYFCATVLMWAPSRGCVIGQNS